jgi:hypothetical protein
MLHFSVVVNEALTIQPMLASGGGVGRMSGYVRCPHHRGLRSER